MEEREVTREEAHELLKQAHRDANRETFRFLRDLMLMILITFVPFALYWYLFGHTFAPLVAIFFTGLCIYYFGFRGRDRRDHEYIDRLYDRKEGKQVR